MINKVILVGNVGKDPETRTLENGTVLSTFSLATSESFKRGGEWEQKTEWHNIVAWKDLAEKIHASFHKGDTVYVEGKITTEQWQDKEGNTRYTTKIVVNYARVINRKNNEAPANGNGQNSAVPAWVTNPVTPTGSTEQAEPTVTADDDLPF